MAANTEDLSDSAVSGFHTIDTVRYENFTPQNLDEFNRILLAIKKNGKFNFLTEFREKLESHIANPAGHEFDLTLLEDEIVDQMYVVFTNYGYTGSKFDMLNNIYKDVTVGNDTDINAGISYDKAMSVIYWKKWFDKHELNLGSHMSIRNIFYHKNTVNIHPIVSITDYNKTTGVDISTIWNGYNGLVVFTYDWKNKKTTGNLFSITTENGTVSCNVSTTGVSVVVDGNTLSIPFNKTSTSNTYLFLFDHNHIVFRDANNRKVIDLSDQNNGSNSLTGTGVGIAFTGTCGVNSDGICKFDYYNHSVSETEELFFLN